LQIILLQHSESVRPFCAAEEVLFDRLDLHEFETIFFVALFFLVICSVTAWAQTITGGVNGTVTDPSGAVIVGAQVTAINVATNITTATKTNKDGVYSIQFLTIGQYKVEVEVPGFAPDTLGPFTLEAGQEPLGRLMSCLLQSAYSDRELDTLRTVHAMLGKASLGGQR
jgi:hypothetical protein